MAVFVDRVKETTTAPGTGNATLLGAATGYQSFNNAVGVGPAFRACMVAVDSNDNPAGLWEVSMAHLSGATTLVRDVVLNGSSGAGTLVNFASGTVDVFLDYPALDPAIARPTAFGLQYGTP